MKILVILPRIPIPARDGGAIVMLETVRALHEAGHVVDVCAVNTPKHHADPDVMEPYCNAVTAVDVDTTIRPFRMLREFVTSRFPEAFRIRVDGSYWLTRFASEEMLMRLEAMILERGPYDAILCESLFTACYGEALRLRDSIDPTVPIVLHAHNVESRIQDRLARDPLRSSVERWYRRRLAQQTEAYERHVLTWISGVVTLSAIDTATFAIAQPSAHVVAVAPGVREHVPTGEHRPQTLWFLGSLDWTPNVDGLHWFMRFVWPTILAQMPDVELHIAGKSTPDAITAYHDGINVVVHGEIEDPTAFRSAYAVGIVPLLSGSGVRIKILEALADHSAVVTTTIGCEGLPLTDDLHVVFADEPTAFAHTCIELLTDEARQTKLRAAGAEFVRSHYSWERSANELHQVLTHIAEREH